MLLCHGCHKSHMSPVGQDNASAWFVVAYAIRPNWHITCICVCVMSVQTRDFVDVAARARALGCRVPVGIALLPGNFSTATGAAEFCFHAATPYVRSAWQGAGLEDEGPSGTGGGDSGSGVNSGIRENGDCTAAHSMGCSEGLSPFSRPLAPSASTEVPLVVYFGPDLLAGPPWRLPVALGLVSSVLASHPRCASPRDVRLDIVVKRPGDHGYACIGYQGDAFGIVALAREVRRIWASQ
jgi:hypothetical protein